MNIPEDRMYTTHDEWVVVDGDVVTVGLTDHAQDALGELVYVDLPEAGSSLVAGEMACEVESVKAVAEVYSPVSGVVAEVNSGVEDSPESINKDPYGQWIYKVQVTDSSDLDSLLDAAAYAEKIQG